MRHLLRRGDESATHYLVRQVRYVRRHRRFVHIAVMTLLVLVACAGFLLVIALK